MKKFLRFHDSTEPETEPKKTGEEEKDEEFQLIASSPEVWAPDSLVFYGKESRSILLSGEITAGLAGGIISQLLELSAEDEKAPIRVYIDTNGGSVDAGLGIYDTMRIVPNPIFTLAYSKCASMGLVVLQGGDFRECFPSTMFMYHEVMYGSEVVSRKEAADMNNMYMHTLNTVNTILKTRTKMPKNIWNKNFEGVTSFHFSAQEALNYKFVDNIVPYVSKKPLKMK